MAVQPDLGALLEGRLMADDCVCRTVEFRVLVTADTYDAAAAKAKEIAESVRSEGPFWITADRYPRAVDRMGCLTGTCARPRVDTRAEGSPGPYGDPSCPPDTAAGG